LRSTPTTEVWAMLEALGAVLVWGASFIATKVALRDVSPITVVWLRFTMGVAMLGTAAAFKKQFTPLPARELGYFALLGFLGITFHQWLQSNGLVTAQATTTAWIITTTPIFIALLGWLVLKERLGWLAAAGIALAMLGVLLVVSRGQWSAVAAGRFWTTGDVLVFISAPNWAVFSVLSRRGLREHPATQMMFYVMGFGWLFTTALFAAQGAWAEVARLSLPGWLGVAFLGIFCSGLAYIFWYDALQRLPASRVGVFLYLEPLVAVVVAALVLGEAVLPAVLIGGGAILAGVWLVNRRG
jgi:drug/metabolite transporter (DMT)-like permease